MSKYSRYSMKTNYNKSIKQMLLARNSILQEMDEIEENVNKASSFLDSEKNKDNTSIPKSEKLGKMKSLIDTLLQYKNEIDKKYEKIQENLEKKYIIYEQLAHDQIAVRSHSVRSHLIKRKSKSASLKRRRNSL